MIRAAVLTAIYDDYDTLKPVLPQDGADVEWICVTDSRKLAEEAALVARPVIEPDAYYVTAPLVHPTGWEIRYQPRPDLHPNRAAKLPKVRPGHYTSRAASVWLDASFRVTSPRLVVDTLTYASEYGGGIAQFRHPWRDCLYDEAVTSIGLPKYAGEADRIDRQWRAYREAGMPYNWGLWACGVIARAHRADVLRWGDAWGDEIEQHSYQDQVSHPYSLWRAGLRPADLPGNHLGNQWLSYEGSGRH